MFEKGGKTRESFLLNENATRLEKKKTKFGSKDLTAASNLTCGYIPICMKKMMKGVLFVMKFPPHPSSRHLMIRIEQNFALRTNLCMYILELCIVYYL